MRIAIIGDVHYSNMRGKSNFYKEFRDDFYDYFFKFFFSQEADLYISSGDLTNFGTKKEYEGIYEIINRYKKENQEFIQVVGNHDLFTCTKEDFENRINQERYGYKDYDNCRVIYIDTANQRNIFNPRGKITEEQMKWLEDKITNYPDDKYAIVVAHHPISEVDIIDDISKKEIKENHYLSYLYKREGKSLYLNAHIHRDRLRIYKNWVGMQFSDILNYPTVRLIDIEENDVEINTKELKDASYRNMGRLVSSGIRTFKYQDLEEILQEPWLRNIKISNIENENIISFQTPPIYTNDKNIKKARKEEMEFIDRLSKNAQKKELENISLFQKIMARRYHKA